MRTLLLRLLILGFVVPGVLLLYLPIRIATGSGWTVDLGPLRHGGPILMGIGTLLYFWSALELGADRRTERDGTHLAIRGPYRFVRSPMYIGGLLVLVGHALWFEAPALLPYILVAFATSHLLIVLLEEPEMRRRFGDEYRVYALSVPRWIPRWPRIDDER